ncbi:Probable RNA-directed DNA polymerase from transposon X-element [Eumeta japonica]|uniref:Probable RNA-directed DNA polymerase from transposon X-element n=1 Tax=Eumeta variegata TaxID=151549 RepID=A0A4C1VSZ9_EUMVA|nr:Probable RNA-directed DNA polymerase from transposon X-element [Eumeta japonica]
MIDVDSRGWEREKGMLKNYASPVFAHAAPKALHRLQVIQNKFCRAATDAHWCVRNSILHRDLELSTISKYMKDASKRFFDFAGSHPNAVDYQPPPPTHFIRRPRNVLIDPPNAFTAAVESLNDVNDTHDLLRVGLSVSQVIDLTPPISLIPPGRR